MGHKRHLIEGKESILQRTLPGSILGDLGGVDHDRILESVIAQNIPSELQLGPTDAEAVFVTRVGEDPTLKQPPDFQRRSLSSNPPQLAQARTEVTMALH